MNAASRAAAGDAPGTIDASDVTAAPGMRA